MESLTTGNCWIQQKKRQRLPIFYVFIPILHKWLMTLLRILQHLSDLRLWRNLVTLCPGLQYSLWRRSASGSIVTGTPSCDRGLKEGRSACARKNCARKDKIVATGVRKP